MKFPYEQFFFILNLNFINSIIRIPFKKIYKESSINPENIMDILLYNDLQINLEIGTPPQLYPVLIKLQESPTFIMSNNFTRNIKKYNPNNSSTYIKKERVESYSQFHCYDSYYILDTLYFDEQKIKKDNFSLVLSNSAKFDSSLSSGELGLKFYSYNFNEKAHFLYQLKEKNLINYPIFTLEYKNNEEGNLIIGDYPHNFNNEIYKEEDFIYSYISTTNLVTQWNIHLDKIISNNIIIDIKANVELYYELSFITGSENYYNTVYQSFFSKYLNNKSCSFENLSKTSMYLYTVCNKTVNITNFPDLIFQSENLKYNFTFNYSELFMEYNEKYYFLIVFKRYKDGWCLGEIFFKKYQIVFDKDKKIYGLYLKKNLNNKISPWLYVIILFFCLMITISLIIYLIRLLMKKRKIRANELEDQFEYLPYNI